MRICLCLLLWMGTLLGSAQDLVEPKSTTLDLLKNGTPKQRRDAAFKLGDSKDPQAIPALLEACRDESPEVRWGACVALGKTKATEAKSALADLSKDKDPEVRWAAVWALGQVGGEESVEVLMRATNDPSVEVARQAKESLRLITEEWWASHENDPKAHHDLGVLLGQRKLYDDALLELDKALQLDPKYAQAYVARGVTWGFKDDLDKAVADFNKAIELDPNLFDAHYYLGVALRKANELDRALSSFLKAYELKKDRCELCYNVACVYAAKGDVTTVATWLSRAIELDPSVKSYALKDEALASMREKEEIKKLLTLSSP